jgi:hypothetical protein
MHKRAMVMALAALGGAAAMLIGTLAPASGDEGKTVRFQVSSPVNASNSQLSSKPVGGTCANTPLVAPCTFLGQGAELSAGEFNDTFSGDFDGTGVHTTLGILSTVLSLSVVDIPFVNREVVSPLTVRGCGRGTLVVQDEGNLNSPSGTWSIVPGSGTGDLAGIRGGGTFFAAQVPLVGNTTVSWAGHISGCTATDR